MLVRRCHPRARYGREAFAKYGIAVGGGGAFPADTIYAIDKFGEEAIRGWFEVNWPASEPVEVIMEGPEESLCFPRGTLPRDTKWKCLLDPIDGTRGIMYDKRSAWALSGIAPQRGEKTRLSEIVVSAMTELPTTKQWRADQVSAISGGGIVAASINVLDGTAGPLLLAPSKATNFRHGFAWMAKFFPEGRALTAQIEEQLWEELVGIGRDASPTVFDDQYICSGGSFYELLAGHDRMIADLRPLILRRLHLETSLVCHPYDVVTASLLRRRASSMSIPSAAFPMRRSIPKPGSRGSPMQILPLPIWHDLSCNESFARLFWRNGEPRTLSRHRWLEDLARAVFDTPP